jgi:hypothetical protein
VGKLTRIVHTFNALTGISGRHDKALRDVSEWTARVQDILSQYNLLEEGSRFDQLLQKAGEAKIDLTSLTYNGHPMIKTAQAIRGTKVSPLVGEVVEGLEEVRRALINPSFSQQSLAREMPRLRESFQELQDTLSKIEYRR